MARKREHPHLLELAKRGAEIQLNDLIHEIEMLVALFPHLRDNFDPDELPVRFLLRRGADRAKQKAERVSSGRRRWSAAQRRAAAERMKKHWAKRRATERS